MFWFDFAWDIQHFLNQWWWQINILLLVILVVLAYLSYREPVKAVTLTIILLPTYLFRSQVWFLPLTFLELCIWVVFGGWLIRTVIKRQPPQDFGRSYRWPIMLILLGATIALAIAPDLRSAAGLWKAYFIEPIMFFLVATTVSQNHKDKETILWAFGLSTLTISLLAIYQKLTAFGILEPSWIAPDRRRVTAMFSSPNAVGLFLGPIVIIYFGWLMAELKNRRQTLIKLAIILPALLAILFTVSQGTWLGLAAGVIFLAFFGWSKKWTSLIVGLAIVAVMLLPMTREAVWPMITLADASGQNRLALAQIAITHLLTNAQNFIFGAGLLGFDAIQDQIRDPLKIEDLLYPHNIIFNFWLEIGLAGLIGFGWLVIKFLRRGFRKFNQRRDWLTLGIMAAMVGVLIHGLIDVPYFKNDLAVLFWLIVALI